MKGIILAGGTGSRLQPITHTTQKQLIPLANKPVIQHVVERLCDTGISDIGVVLGDHYPDKVRNTLEDCGSRDVELTYIHQGEPLGLAHAVSCCEDFVKDEPFLVYFGDTILGRNLLDTLVSGFDKEDFDGSLVFQEVENPSRFGVANIADGNLSGVLEKPDDPPSNLAYIGAVVLTKKVFAEIEHLEPSWRGEIELTHALDRLVKKGKVRWEVENGLWKDVGTPDDVIETNKILMENIATNGDSEENTTKVILGADSSIGDNVTIREPVIIGENTTITGKSVIGPYTCIGDRCIISDSKIQSSVIMNDTELHLQDRLSKSIISNNSSINTKNEGITTLVVSEDTLIE
ncbi:glucose-1-phosphate thymidylyltransferase [Halorubrum sp. N11]|uniref:glucose-1-phosphate thymidylyltransferase n=1 Tax=Halorubrum sp. N11 TaxID=3402276 RepID=UPI003EB7FFCA